MPDIVVTIPKSFGLEAWLAEGDAAGEPESGQEYYFSIPTRPKIEVGERVYVVFNGKLHGYAPLVDIEEDYLYEHRTRYFLVRKGGAVAVTIDQPIKGFRGFRYRWWERDAEKPFPDWRIP